MNSTTLTSNCQELFSGHFKEFTRFTFEPNSLIFPDILSNLHRFVAYFVPLSRALGYTITPSPICQHLFSCFFKIVRRRATAFIFGSKRFKNLRFWFRIVHLVAILSCREMQLFLVHGRWRFSASTNMQKHVIYALPYYINGNSATEFAVWDGRMSIHGIATPLSVRQF